MASSLNTVFGPLDFDNALSKFTADVDKKEYAWMVEKIRKVSNRILIPFFSLIMS